MKFSLFIYYNQMIHTKTYYGKTIVIKCESSFIFTSIKVYRDNKLIHESFGSSDTFKFPSYFKYYLKTIGETKFAEHKGESRK